MIRVMVYSFRAIATPALVMIMHFIAQTSAGYGDVSGGLPSWKERQILVLTNACRMAPIQYRDTYVGNYAILDSLKYPAVPPLYASNQLNASARAHALDMGDTCGTLQHNSCNNTPWDTRIKSYYKASSWIGENIAVGNSDPFATMNQWILDIRQGANQPAADSSLCTLTAGSSSLCDGHRWNIMNKQYKELGAGHTYGTNSAVRSHYFWVQDFGGGQSSVSNPIAGGAHFLRESGKTAFLVNYWDQSSKAPVEVSVIVGGQKNSMTLLMGSPFCGTYQSVIARAANCRPYYFSFSDNAGKAWRYPETGSLVTAGEGNCSTEYEFQTNTVIPVIHPSLAVERIYIVSRVIRASVIISVRTPRFFPQSTSLIDGKGRTLLSRRWPGLKTCVAAAENIELHMVLPKKPCEGIYFLSHRISDTFYIGEKIIVAP
jgi:hypothetical protein